MVSSVIKNQGDVQQCKGNLDKWVLSENVVPHSIPCEKNHCPCQNDGVGRLQPMFRHTQMMYSCWKCSLCIPYIPICIPEDISWYTHIVSYCSHRDISSYPGICSTLIIVAILEYGLNSYYNRPYPRIASHAVTLQIRSVARQPSQRPRGRRS